MILEGPVKTLEEWQTRTWDDIELTSGDQALVGQLSGEDRQLEIDQLATGLRVRARSWVGVVHFENVQLHIVPKLAGGNLGLADMLSFTRGIDALSRNAGVRRLKLDENGSLFDLVALIFAEECEKVIDAGLLRDYVVEESDLPVLRGRLLADKQILRRMGRIDRLECRFDEHSTNILENQIVAAALYACRPHVGHPIVRQKIHRLHALFLESCLLPDFDLFAARGSLMYNRLNEHYRDAHDLAWLILEGLGIRDLLAAGKTRSFAFLLDMNQLFEIFVYRLIERMLRGQPYRVYYQRKNRSIIWNADAKRPYASVIPDLVIESGFPDSYRLAIDSKYKLYDEHKLSPDDIYQTFIYAYAYGDRKGLPQALIVYPASDPAAAQLHLQIRNTASAAGASIQALAIHIPSVLEALKTTTKFVLQPLMQTIESCLVGPCSDLDSR